MNKYQEAIEIIKKNYPDSGYTMLRKALDLAIEVLEKATPKKPLEVFEFEFDVHLFGNCPICGEGCNSGMKYCGRCGQALDWSEEDDC